MFAWQSFGNIVNPTNRGIAFLVGGLGTFIHHHMCLLSTGGRPLLSELPLKAAKLFDAGCACPLSDVPQQ